MPFVSKGPAAPTKDCKLPSLRRGLNAGVGAIWRCPKCGNHWEFVGDWNGLWRSIGALPGTDKENPS